MWTAWSHYNHIINGFEQQAPSSHWMHSCGCVLQILTSLSSASGGLVAMRWRINSQTSSGFLLVFSQMQSNCKLTEKNCVSWLLMWLLCWWVLFQPLIMNSDEVWKLSQWTSDNIQLIWLKSSKIISSYFDWCPPTPNSDSSNLPWSGLDLPKVQVWLLQMISKWVCLCLCFYLSDCLCICGAECSGYPVISATPLDKWVGPMYCQLAHI